MGSSIEVVNTIVRREIERLRSRDQRLSRTLKQLRETYPSARCLAPDVEAVERANEVLVGSLGEIDFGEKIATIKERLAAVLAEYADEDPVSFRWDDEGGAFYVDTAGPAWRTRREESSVEIVELIEQDIAETGVVATEEHGKGVTYPIIFTHEIEGNHRAVISSIGWSLMAAAASCDDDFDIGELRRSDDILELSETDESWADEIPGADTFGFTRDGELFRKLRDFDHIDPEAHWIRWVEKSDRLPRQTRVLREQGGAKIRIEVDRPLRRLRIVERSRSEVVRKRHNVFVDPQKERIEDRFFADDETLDKAVEERLRHYINDGYRIVE